MYAYVLVRHCFVKSQVGWRCGISKSDGSCRLGAYWLYFGCSTTERVLSYLCVSRGVQSLFCFLLPHPRGCRTTDNTRTKRSRYLTVCQSTKPFDCVSTLTDAVAPTTLVWRVPVAKRAKKTKLVVGIFPAMKLPPW